MSDKDQFNTQAEPIFRQIVQAIFDAALPDSVGIGIIADALRKQAWINDAVYQGMEKKIAEIEQSKDVAKMRTLLAERYGARTACDSLHADIDQLRTSLDKINDACLRAEAERDQLKVQLAEAEKQGFVRGLEWAKGLMNNDGQCTVGAHDVIDLAKTNAEMEKP